MVDEDDVPTQMGMTESIARLRALASRGDEPEAADSPRATGAMMDLLAEHVPLTLLADLGVVDPVSEEILEAEGLPVEAWWEPEAGAAPEPDGTKPVPPEPAAAG